MGSLMASGVLKIVFVYPDFENLGVEYLMAICLECGFDVEFVAYEAENSYFNKKRDLSFLSIAGRIAKTQPDMVAFSCVTDNYRNQLECAKSLKKISPDTSTIFGGIHITTLPEKALQESCVDSIAIGEADVSLPKFLKECHKQNGKVIFPSAGIDGIVFKKNNEMVGEFKEGQLADLNMLPYPYKEPFFPDKRGLANEYRIITSRGCPYSCTYCFNSFLHEMRGKKVIKQRNVENVINELIWAKDKYSIKKVFFIDDSFTTNKKWIREFSEQYKRKVKLPFACIANPDYIDNEVAELLRSAGCVLIQIGVQSISEDISKKIIKRSATREKIAQAISSLKDAGIMIQVDHMLGIPGDNIENQEESILFYNKLRPDLISVFWLTYYPKTPILKEAIRLNLLSLSDIQNIENGIGITETSFHNGGSMKDASEYYGIHFLLNYLPFLPSRIVEKIILRKTYRKILLKNYYITTAIPRVVRSIFDRRYFTGRNLLLSYVRGLYGK